MEEWEHADVDEREHWGNESLRYLLRQVCLIFTAATTTHSLLLVSNSDARGFLAGWA